MVRDSLLAQEQPRGVTRRCRRTKGASGIALTGPSASCAPIHHHRLSPSPLSGPLLWRLQTKLGHSVMNNPWSTCLFALAFLWAACGDHPDPPITEAPATQEIPSSTATVLAPEEGERLQFFDGRHALLKVTRESNGAQQLLLGTEALPPGTAIPVHSHDGYEEVIFVHEGTPHLTLGDSKIKAEPGTVMYIPPGTWHGVEGGGSDSTTILFIFPETDIAEFFRAVGQGEGEEPPQLSGEDWARIMTKHQMRSRPD